MSSHSDALRTRAHDAWRRLLRTAATFVGEPSSARPLAALRIGTAIVLIGQTYSIAPCVLWFYGSRGIIQAPIIDALLPATLPRVGYILRALNVQNENLVLVSCFATYVVALHLLAIGWNTRFAAVVAWLLQLTLKTSGNASAYGVFEFSTIALFYCAVMPVGAAFSLDARSRDKEPLTPEATLSLRVLQVHLCVVYLASGIEKASGVQWRNGEAMWRALMRPRSEWLDLSWMADHPWVPLIACWSTLVIEIGYAVFVWPRVTRLWWALATIGMHAAIAVLIGLWTFSALMIVLTVSAFIAPTCISAFQILATRGWRAHALAS